MPAPWSTIAMRSSSGGPKEPQSLRELVADGHGTSAENCDAKRTTIVVAGRPPTVVVFTADTAPSDPGSDVQASTYCRYVGLSVIGPVSDR